MSYVDIDQPSADGLRNEVWRFWYWDTQHRLVLDSYVLSERATRRHKHVAAATYQRLSIGHWSYDAKRLTATDVPWPAWLTQRAIAAFTSGLTVATELP